MEIEVSKLKWYYDKPKFEDVEGKTVVVNHYCNGDRDITCIFVDEHEYNLYIDNGEFIRYAIIDTSEEPLQLDVVVPEVIEICNPGRSCVVINTPDLILQIYGATREEAIANWNAFVRRMK